MQPSPQTHPSPHFTNPQQSLHYVRPFGVNDPHDLSLLPYHSQQPSDNHSVNGFRSIQLNINGHTDFPNPIILKTQYKTALCRWHTNMGYCYFGDRCRFAHGEKELRNHSLYKTKPCRLDSKIGGCPHGSFCKFLHKSDIPGLRRPEEVTPIGFGIWSPRASNYSGAQCSFKGGITSIRAHSPLGYYQQPITEEVSLPPLLGVHHDSGDALHQSSGSLKSFGQDQRHAPHWKMFADSAGAFNMHDTTVKSYNDANDGNRMDWGMPTVDSFQMISRD